MHGSIVIDSLARCEARRERRRLRALRAWVVAAFFSVALCGRTGFAQRRFGGGGSLALTAEDLFGISSESTTVREDDGDHTDQTSRFGLLYESRRAPGVMSPRGGAHYFVIPSLSIGATVGYEHRGGSTTEPRGSANAPVTRDKGGGSAFVFLPKVGYAFMFNDVVGLWPRAGLGWLRNTDYPNPNSTIERDTTSFLVFSLDALLVVSPVANFGFYVGPGVDLSLSGSTEGVDDVGVGTSRDSSFRRFDLAFGVLGYLDL